MLGYYYAQLRKKKEEVSRLNVCQSSLQGKQQEFSANDQKCLDPELAAKTWHGNHASKFEDIREAGIHAPYMEMAGTQFSKAFTAIADKIASLLAEIASIEQTIARILAEQAAAAAAARAAAQSKQ
ncbi:DUF5082 domain-containing protein [Sporosarcina sp. NPDC096371]|uniref:DUF5082 domain-containing protein n=1 Tax=Sporosarcina sp. NPDC096371 TaxID=3364530 RepID=UPI003825FEF3